MNSSERHKKIFIAQEVNKHNLLCIHEYTLIKTCASQLNIECDALHMTAGVHPQLESVLKIQMDDLKELHLDSS